MVSMIAAVLDRGRIENSRFINESMPLSSLPNPQILKTVPLFSSFSDQQIAALASWIQRRSYPRGAAILRAGEETDALYIIMSGRVKVLIPDEEGHEVILTMMEAQDFVGEMGLLDGLPSSATVETLEPCEMLRLPRTAFNSLLENNSEVAMLVLRNVVKRLRDADRKIESLALIDVYGRVARLIIDMAERSRREMDRSACACQAGNCAHDRRFARNGEPGSQGFAGKGFDTYRQAQDFRARPSVNGQRGSAH